MDTVKVKRTLLNGVVNRISRVGVELEGAWTIPPDMQIVHDGSVHVERPKVKKDPTPAAMVMMTPAEARRIVNGDGPIFNTKAPAAFFAVGEIPTPKPGLAIEDVKEWMTKYYPQIVNETCGMHVHMSFMRKLHYHRLMTPNFTTTMVASLLEWSEEEKLGRDHPIWNRLKDPNHPHCAHTYCGDKQVTVTKKDYHSRGKPYSRYTAINYCMGQHGTVECRLLPMMETTEQGVRAVMRVLDTTNKFLAKDRVREKREGGSVPIREDMVLEFKRRIR